MLIRFIIISSSFCWGIVTFFTGNYMGEQKNTPPQVRIQSPKGAVNYPWNTVIPYAVTVSDKEDGESKYDEIPATDVFLELRYFTDPAKGTAYAKNTAQKEPAGYSIIKKLDCFTCHSVHSKLIGPSYSDISKKYKNPGDVAAIAGRVIKGSVGRWGPVAMPTHPDLSEKNAELVVKWILEKTNNPDVDYFRGAEGSFRIQPSPNATANGIFVLKATYTDRGINDDSTTSLPGQDVISFGVKKD
jgi:cytochrome c